MSINENFCTIAHNIHQYFLNQTRLRAVANCSRTKELIIDGAMVETTKYATFLPAAKIFLITTPKK